MGQRKWIRALAVVAALAALGACSTDREVTRPKPVPVTEERLTEALITDADVPAPYALAEDAEPLGPELVPEHECDDPLQDLEPKETASVTFTGTSIGTTLTNTIAYYPGQGSQVTRRYRDIEEDCEQVVVAAEGISFTTDDLDFGVLSDDTLPLVVVIEQEDGTIEERNVIVMRTGDLVSTIRLDGPRPTDLEVLDTVVRSAIGYLGLLDQDT